MDGKQGNNASSPSKEDDSPSQQGAASRPPPSATSALGMPSGRLPPFVGISGVAPSPPQFVTMEEIMSAANGLTNMRLFHEIAVDQDFKLTPYDPPENSIEKAVKDAAHRAFWDLLSKELEEDPPVYTRALILLEEVKTILLELVLPQQEKMIQEINEMIDVPFIQQQAENGALDFLGYAQHIINVMGRICAPARDENIQKLKEISDPIDIFKGVFETLTLMRLDFANFGIQMLRTNIMGESVEYEKKKFAEALALQGGIDSLVITKEWLRRHLEKTPNGTEKEIVLNAYLEMFAWGLPEKFPETVVMDSARHRELGQRLHQLVIAGTVLLVTLSRAALPALQQSTSFKEKLLNDVKIVLQDVKDDEALKNILPSVAVQVISIVKTYTNQGTESNQVQQTVLVDAAFEQSLSELIKDIHRPDHNVRRIVNERTTEFVYQSLASLPNVPKQVPPGMTSLRPELLSTTASIIRLYKYNLAVFGDYYCQIISKLKEENTTA